jgi:mono/diheme cytochrome c family protein
MVNRSLTVAALWTVVLGAGALAGCREQTSDEPPILLERNMYDSESYKAQGSNEFFADHRNMRQPPAGSLAREYYDDNHLVDVDDATRTASFSGYATGLAADGTSYVMTVPDEALRQAAKLVGESDDCLAMKGTDAARNECALIHRGQQRYGIYCVPCHSKVGDGMGTVVRRTNGRVTDPNNPNSPPVTPGPMSGIPDFTLTRIRQMPDGQVFNTITHGLSRMPAYGAQIPVEDRWAIVSYLRALQLSQMAMRHPEDKK